MDIVHKVEQAMRQDKLYLNPSISFERLAEQLDIPVKDLSNAINRHFQINFYEYINRYRIQEAEQQLLEPANQNKTITDIFYAAGFNSKSVYNTLFKKKYGVTPSAYRKKHS
jgi:AraC-like DNA-binding protein